MLVQQHLICKPNSIISAWKNAYPKVSRSRSNSWTLSSPVHTVNLSSITNSNFRQTHLKYPSKRSIFCSISVFVWLTNSVFLTSRDFNFVRKFQTKVWQTQWILSLSGFQFLWNFRSYCNILVVIYLTSYLTSYYCE